MTVSASSFRTDFTEFADTAAYLDSDINLWLKFAGVLLNADRWGSLLDLGTELYVAHNLSLGAQSKAEAAIGAAPGQSVGIVNNKSVENVSAGYDTASVIDPEAGHWNKTTYGLRFRDMVKMVGAGPIQVGVGCGGSPAAWPGVVFPYSF